MTPGQPVAIIASGRLRHSPGSLVTKKEDDGAPPPPLVKDNESRVDV